MTTWRNQYVHVNEYSRPGIKLKEVRKLIVHWTANPGATAANHFSYFDKSIIAAKRYASAHIFVDKTEAICIIPLNEVAYAANDNTQMVNGKPYRGVSEIAPNANYLTISVELCVEKDGSFHADTIARAVDVFAELCKTYKLDPNCDIVRHYDVTHKNCPAPWVANGNAFVAFKQHISDKLKPKEEDEMLEKAIVINAFPDFPSAEVLAARLHAPIYTRAALPSGKIAKEVYVVGGTKDGLVADSFVMLTGKDRFEVAKAVGDFLK